jgi:dTDP-4-dehydrorhamnose reductase
MAKPVILVTGANGQLGKELQELAPYHDNYDFVFATKEDLPIHDEAKVEAFFAKHQPAFCINCAAYTAVDKAETEKETAFAVNAAGTATIAAACTKHNTKLIHISTDYVFDGQSPLPYKEDAPVNPINTYGASKLKGEQLCLEKNSDAIIIRTAWVYSSYGHNFVKTMLRLMGERPSINVVNDQIGAPTYAADLANCIMHIITVAAPDTRPKFPETQNPPRPTLHPALVTGHWTPGIYHYSNRGRISWYDFAVAIRDMTHSNCVVNPIPSSQYPTPAKRPSFSLLDTNKIAATYRCEIPDWRDALERCLQKLKNV